MSRSGGQSEARPPAFKFPSKLGTHLLIHCRGVGTSGSKRCHLHEDQAQDVLDRPVIEKTVSHIVRNARVQPTASSVTIQGQVAPSLEFYCVFSNHTMTPG
ncbi:hypothetical protein TNCV_965461 [Trichonephila clavipes]|nr:hypothetical protein TNCV_965461 [Trichonephila clavipes]